MGGVNGGEQFLRQIVPVSKNFILYLPRQKTSTKHQIYYTMTQKQKNYAIPLAFVGMMFFSLGFALGINSFLIPVLKDSLSLPSGVAYLLLAATFVPFLIFGYPASKTIAAIGYKRTMALSFLIFAAAFVLFVLSAKQESFPLFLIASFVSGAANAYLQANKGEMSADQIGAAEKVVKAGMEIEEIDATARNILSGTKSLQEALRAVNGVDARIRTKVRTQVRQAYADVESAMKAENQANKKLAWQQLQTQGKIEPTLRAEMFEKDPEALARLDNYAEKQAGGGLKYSDQTVLAGIERLADSDPEEFKRLDILEDFGDKLRAEDIRALQKKQRNIDVEEHKDFLAAVKSAAKVEGVRTADIPKVSLAAGGSVKGAGRIHGRTVEQIAIIRIAIAAPAGAESPGRESPDEKQQRRFHALYSNAKRVEKQDKSPHKKSKMSLRAKKMLAKPPALPYNARAVMLHRW